MLSRWIQENQRFLAMVGGAALLLLIFQWWFVWGNRRAYTVKRKAYDSNVQKLKDAYGNEDPPVSKRRDQRAREADAVRVALDEALRNYGSRPASPFILPAGEEDKPQNYYLEQQNNVVDEIKNAAGEFAVDISDPRLGLPDQMPRGAEAKATVENWLWNLQVVRRACLSAIRSGVDVIEKVVEVRDARSAIEGSQELFGYPQQFEVAGRASAVAAWLEAIQRDDNFLVLVQCKIKRDPQQLGVVRCLALIMGVSRRERPTEAQE